MPKEFKSSYFNFILSILVVISFMTFYGCGGGSDSSDETDDTTDDTTGSTGYVYLPYGETPLPTVTSFSDAAYDLAAATSITLNGSSITVTGTGATVSGSVVTVTAAGTYNISGTLSDGQVKVDTADAGDVRLYLNGIDITSSTASPVDIENAERVIIVLADNTDNYLTDGTSNDSVDGDDEAIDAALFSKDDLVIYGSGSLTVDANYKDGIKCKDGLIIAGGNINVTSVDDGIIGKNFVSVESGAISVYAWGDGLKSTNEGTDTQGYVVIKDGTIDIIAGADAIQAETHIVVKDGTFNLTTNGGSGNPIPATDTTTSAKGFKTNVGITIDGGDFSIDASDDAFHSGDTIIINNGNYSIASGDDAIHSETTLTIYNGDIDITTCFEGLEGKVITINDGYFRIIATDDGINATEGLGRDYVSPNCHLYINGGYVYINSGSDIDSDGVIESTGDGIDSNSYIDMTGGTVITNGPINGPNEAIDFMYTFTMTGGFIIGAGNSSMAQAPGSSSSTVYSILLNFTETYNAGTLFHLQKNDGTEIVTFSSPNQYNSIGFASSIAPKLENGSTYNIYIGGSYSGGTITDGLCSGGTYSGGTQLTGDYTFTVSDLITSIGTGGGFPGGGGGGMPGGPPGGV